MTGFVKGFHRDQKILLPESLDDYIHEESAVRFIDAFVESLDLHELGFTHAEPNDMGRHPTCPVIS